MNEELENLILELTAVFESKISDKENEKENLIKAFKNYLYLVVEAIQESTSKFINKDLESIKRFLSSIAKDFYKGDLEYAKRTLLADKAFEEIREKSLQIFELAKSSIRGKKEERTIDVEKEIERMESLLEQVKDYNQKQAQELVSEAIVDGQYINSIKKDVLSLRLYHFKRRMKNMEVDR